MFNITQTDCDDLSNIPPKVSVVGTTLTVRKGYLRALKKARSR